MALTYRNTLKKHIVEVPEPADIVVAAEQEAERLLRLGTKRARLDAELLMDKANSRALHMRQTLKKMDESRRWERYTAPPVVETPPAPEPVIEAEVRVEAAGAPKVEPAKKVTAAKVAKLEPEAA